jgi:hypothetical protein
MRKTILVISEFILFAVGVALFIYPFIIARQAARLDNSQGLSGGGGPTPICQPTSYNFQRIMTDQESQVLQVTFSNDQGKCDIFAELSTTDFDYSPTNMQDEELSAHQQKTVAWDIYPKRVGNYYIIIRTPTLEKTIGIAVTNVLGWNALQIHIWGMILALLGVVGGIGTIFGWFSKAFNFVQKKQGKSEESESIKSNVVQGTSAKTTRVNSNRQPQGKRQKR